MSGKNAEYDRHCQAFVRYLPCQHWASVIVNVVSAIVNVGHCICCLRRITKNALGDYLMHKLI